MGWPLSERSEAWGVDKWPLSRIACLLPDSGAAGRRGRQFAGDRFFISLFCSAGFFSLLVEIKKSSIAHLFH